MFAECTRWFEERETPDERNLARKLGGAGWGLFFAWIGLALLMDVGTGIGLLGVGIVTLGVQAARNYFGLRLEGFWVVVGVLFAVGGLWELFEVKLSLVPILLIAAGLALFVSALTRGKNDFKEKGSGSGL